MTELDLSKPWFHGSPYALQELRIGSTITQDRELARVFSHKPPLVCISDDGRIKHNGRADGFLYLISETIQGGDIVLVPRSTMAPGKEWFTTGRAERKGNVLPRWLGRDESGEAEAHPTHRI